PAKAVEEAPAPSSPETVTPESAAETVDKPMPKRAPIGVLKPGATLPDGQQPAEPKDASAKQGKKSLFAPAGLMSRVPPLANSTAPGLGKLDLNRATIEQIQRLPGVGLIWAPRILAGRPYRTFGDIGRTGVPYNTVDALSREVELGR